MHGLAVDDPYVERLLEGVGFLAARVQLKLDAEFPRFTQALLEIVYPHYLAPTPSMLVAQMQPDKSEPGPASGTRTEPRGSALYPVLAPDAASARPGDRNRGTSSCRPRRSSRLASPTTKRCCRSRCGRFKATGCCR